MIRDGSKDRSVLNAGLDEVGMGPWAGPVLVVVAAFPFDKVHIPGVTDSKRLSKAKREELAPKIIAEASFIGCGWVTAAEIDKHRLGNAWQMAASRALTGAPEFAHLLIDGQRKVKSYSGDQDTFVKGELQHWQIAAASVVAKVLRDHEMDHLAEFYPSYGFDRHSGYGTDEHKTQLYRLGPCREHRMTFLRKFIAKFRPSWAKDPKMVPPKTA
jgi:ribonuclease HII